MTTYSDCISSKSCSFPGILVVVTPKVENCGIIPHEWKHKPKQKTARKDIYTHVREREREREREKEEVAMGNSREPSNSTATARKGFVKLSQSVIFHIAYKGIVIILMLLDIC